MDQVLHVRLLLNDAVSISVWEFLALPLNELPTLTRDVRPLRKDRTSRCRCIGVYLFSSSVIIAESFTLSNARVISMLTIRKRMEKRMSLRFFLHLYRLSLIGQWPIRDPWWSTVIQKRKKTRITRYPLVFDPHHPYRHKFLQTQKVCFLL